MSGINRRIQSAVKWGEAIENELEKISKQEGCRLSDVLKRAVAENAWFDEGNVLHALEAIRESLRKESVEEWINSYTSFFEYELPEMDVAVVNAGNIPFVGFHDLLTVFLSGNRYTGKNATGDSCLLPFLADLLISVQPDLASKINFVPRIGKMDAVIATGSNNSSHYFEYYFGKYPHVIRKNRNGICVLNGNETNEQLRLLGSDIFTYYGLGCRNISKIYAPENYLFDRLFEAIYEYNHVMQHLRYMNNFDYNNSVFLLKRMPFLQNGFLILREESQIASPVAVVHYEIYKDKNELREQLVNDGEQIQCVVSADNFFAGDARLKSKTVDFGRTQRPRLADYADGVDTLKFLMDAKREAATIKK